LDIWVRFFFKLFFFSTIQSPFIFSLVF